MRLPEDLRLTPEQFTADGSVLSPDASLLRLVRWDALTAEQRRGFPPLCPDLVVELASTSGASAADEGPAGLAADPRTAGGGVWCAGGGASCEPQRLEAASELDAGPLFPGLRLDLQEIWQVSRLPWFSPHPDGRRRDQNRSSVLAHTQASGSLFRSRPGARSRRA